MRILTGAAVLATVILLAGCASDTVGPGDDSDDLVTSTVGRETIPEFLAEPQEPRDLEAVEAIDLFEVDPDSYRYQGEWEGKDVYLAYVHGITVHLITGTPGEEGWSDASTIGNAVLGLGSGTGEELGLQYLPQGTADVPEGWTALSDWVIVRSSD